MYTTHHHTSTGNLAVKIPSLPTLHPMTLWLNWCPVLTSKVEHETLSSLLSSSIDEGFLLEGDFRVH